MLARRMGRPGLLGTVARTAVIAGTARATTNAMDRSAQRRAAEQQTYADQQAAEQQAAMAQQIAAQQQMAPPPPTSASTGDDLIAKLQQLGQLHQSGVLSDEEFAAAKAKLLS